MRRAMAPSSMRMTYRLTHLIEQAADIDPAHPALRHRGQTLTYGELLERASALAHALIEDGVAPGDRVGILLQKSFDSAVALYGIMAAGAAYVPLDPGSPVSRLAFVLRDCGITRLVSENRALPSLRGVAEAGASIDAVFGIDGDHDVPFTLIPWREVATRPTTPPQIPTTEQDLCYVLYTSGSTGTPKGIMHTHRSALAWAEVTAAEYELSSRDILSNYAPLHFDLSTLDYFGGARARATTVIIPEEHTRFPASLASLIAEERMTVLYTVPLALVRLAVPGMLDGKDLSDLRLVLFGGEPMPIKHLRHLMRSLPKAQFVNVYGPTETNGCTHYRVPAVPDEGSLGLPIGRPYPNVAVRVVDSEGRQVGVGGTGELLVRAPTMMRGYWARPDLSERAMVNVPGAGGRPDVYHATGDLVSPTEEGDLAFLGRRDRQIKARGNRVELDEVEAVLLEHPLVHEAAVYALADDEGSLQPHAEVILVPGSSATVKDIRTHAAGALPPYAVPASIAIRAGFPRTSTGKTDRLRLLTDAQTRRTTIAGDPA
jgi:amino acid adenylation domain-containing protein